MLRRTPARPVGVLLLAATLSGCLAGPNYHRPSAPTPTVFKEGPEAANWRPAQPLDAIPKGEWWTVFNDEVLNSLERRVNISNQTVAEAAAAYQEARAVVAESRAELFPTVSATGSATRTHSGGRTGGVATTTGGLTGATTAGGLAGTTTTPTVAATTTTSGFTENNFQAGLGATWAPDLWGSIRRTIESNKAAAQASAAQLANAELTAQAELAADYVTLRVLDEEKRVYDEEIKAYQESLRVTRNQYRAGTIAETNVITSQAALLAVQASAQNIGVARAQNEHAIAILIGVPPAELTIAPIPFNRTVPVPPTGLPSTLLQRRPDIAAAERAMQEENALIGVQVAAYYPSVTLSGEYGFSAANLSNFFSAANSLWSLGANVSETLLDFGLRKARVRAAKAAYEEAVATYRQTVLSAFQGVEDELVALRIYESEQKVLEEADSQAKIAVKEYLNQYQAGTVDYTTVVTAEATELSDAIQLLTIIEERQVAAVTLIEDLGGGWSAADLPKKV